MSMQDEVITLAGYPIDFKIDDFDQYQNVLTDGEPIEITKKLPGTNFGITVVPGLFHPELLEYDTLVYSTEIGATGLVFKQSANNLCLNTARDLHIREKLTEQFANQKITLFGVCEPVEGFSGFDIFVGEPYGGHYLDRADFESAMKEMDLPIVPILYQGGFSEHIVSLYAATFEEGIVIRTMVESDRSSGRIVLEAHDTQETM